MSWLYLFIARLVGGERWRKATPAERRYFAGVFFFVPVAFMLLLVLQRSHSRILRFFDSGALPLWIVFTVGISATMFCCIVWSRHVSARTSLVLAILAWFVLLLLLFGLGFWDFGKT